MSGELAGSGRIIHLNGASSAGKTSIGRELQRVLPEPYLLLGIDSFITMMPERLFGGEDGLRFVPSAEGALRADLGPRALRVFNAMYDAVTALVRAGNHAVFDDVMTSKERLQAMAHAWRGLDVLLVGVRCDPAVAEARERARGDRAIGLARGSSAIAHQHLAYDIEVDSGVMSAAACASEIEDYLRTGSRHAFARLCEQSA